MSRLTLPVVLIAVAAAFPAGASASAGFVPSAPVSAGSASPEQQPQQDVPSSPSASDGFEWADAGLGAAVVLGLLCVAGATLLLATRTRRRTA